MKSRTITNKLIKDKVTFIKTAAETNGAYTLVDIELMPGGGNELHYHRSFDETFECLEGQLGVQIGKKNFHLGPGESKTVYRNVIHRFFNNTDQPVRFRVKLMPGSSGFEDAVRIAYGLVNDGKTSKKGIPKNVFHLAVLIKWGDTNMSGFFRLLEPLFTWLAQIAERKGINKQLYETYCKN